MDKHVGKHEAAFARPAAQLARKFVGQHERELLLQFACEFRRLLEDMLAGGCCKSHSSAYAEAWPH